MRLGCLSSCKDPTMLVILESVSSIAQTTFSSALVFIEKYGEVAKMMVDANNVSAIIFCIDKGKI